MNSKLGGETTNVASWLACIGLVFWGKAHGTEGNARDTEPEDMSAQERASSGSVSGTVGGRMIHSSINNSSSGQACICCQDLGSRCDRVCAVRPKQYILKNLAQTSRKTSASETPQMTSSVWLHIQGRASLRDHGPFLLHTHSIVFIHF